MSLKIPPRPTQKNARIKELVDRCAQIRKRMGLNRTKFLHFFNGNFLPKKQAVNIRRIIMWEWDTKQNWPDGDTALALLAFCDWAEAREKSMGYIYLHDEGPKTRAIYDENLVRHEIPDDREEWTKST